MRACSPGCGGRTARNAMGLGPPILALYRQMKLLGAFEGVHNVVELGAQAVWCPQTKLTQALFEAFGKGPAPADMLDRFANWKGSGRELYEALGFTYDCMDLDPSFGSLRFDLNLDSVPPTHAGKYEFVTNHGTSEHLLNQYNCFKVMHELCATGGMMLHAVPFTVHLEHGFFNYQPNFFSALGRYNNYETLGVWVGPDWQLRSLIPWEKGLLDYLKLDAKTTHLLVVLQKKLKDRPFGMPFQEIYEDMVPAETLERYSIAIDGAGIGGDRGKHLEDVPGRLLLAEVRKRIANRILRKFGLPGTR
jgi:hypothetical protein